MSLAFSRVDPAACDALCGWVENRDLDDDGVKKQLLQPRAWVLRRAAPWRLIGCGLRWISGECSRASKRETGRG